MNYFWFLKKHKIYNFGAHVKSILKTCYRSQSVSLWRIWMGYMFIWQIWVEENWSEQVITERAEAQQAARFSNEGDVLTGLAVFSAASPATGEKGPSRLGLESRSRASWVSTACFCCCSFHVWPAWALSSLSSPQTARSFSLISSIYRTEHSTVTYAHAHMFGLR